MNIEFRGLRNIVLSRRTRPLLQALQRLGHDVGSMRLEHVAQELGSSLPLGSIVPHAVAMCVVVESRDAALQLLVRELLTVVSEDDLEEGCPVAAIDLPDNQVIVVFLGAIGQPLLH